MLNPSLALGRTALLSFVVPQQHHYYITNSHVCQRNPVQGRCPVRCSHWHKQIVFVPRANVMQEQLYLITPHSSFTTEMTVDPVTPHPSSPSSHNPGWTTTDMESATLSNKVRYQSVLSMSAMPTNNLYKRQTYTGLYLLIALDKQTVENTNNSSTHKPCLTLQGHWPSFQPLVQAAGHMQAIYTSNCWQEWVLTSPQTSTAQWWHWIQWQAVIGRNTFRKGPALIQGPDHHYRFLHSF